MSGRWGLGLGLGVGVGGWGWGLGLGVGVGVWVGGGGVNTNLNIVPYQCPKFSSLSTKYTVKTRNSTWMHYRIFFFHFCSIGICLKKWRLLHVWRKKKLKYNPLPRNEVPLPFPIQTLWETVSQDLQSISYPDFLFLSSLAGIWTRGSPAEK